MKLDKDYSGVLHCPITKKVVSHHEKLYSAGICKSCGHVSGCTVTHAVQLSGKWLRPTLIEWLFVSKRKRFLIESNIFAYYASILRNNK